MAETPDDQHEKEGVPIGRYRQMRCGRWSATLFTASYLGIFPQMKMDNTFVASLLTGAMASFGIERKSNGNGNKKPTIVDNKDSKAGIK